jgi:hypothetical protein
MRFNPPPNWPVASTWTPDERWEPDPSWPPAPPGWPFWLAEEPQTSQFPPVGPAAETEADTAIPTGASTHFGYPAPAAPTRRRAVLLTVVAAVVAAAAGAAVAFVNTGHRPGVADSDSGSVASSDSNAIDSPVGARTTVPSDQSAPSAASTGDLNLAIPMSRPACDGTGIVVLASLSTPGSYAQDVSRALAAHPGASYLRTDQACPSLRQAMPNGAAIYAVYVVAGSTKAQLCTAVHAADGDAYGKWLDTTTDPHTLITC